jgi:group I intron endonuclease
VNFCGIDVFKPDAGSVYGAKCKTTGKYYVGSAKDVEERWNEHKNAKFANALKQYGLDDFEWVILATINYANRDELYKLEHEYILKYDNINNGYNSRLNLKSSIGPST